MTAKNFEIIPLEVPGEIPWEFLLLADPSRANIEKYIPDSDIFLAKLNGQLCGCYVLYPADKETIEIKNIAVKEAHQGKGIGSLLLRDAKEKSKSKGAKKLLIGTGNSSVGQLYLYQKAGFRITGIKPDFFTENYEETIWENGILCRDMIILTMEI